MILDKETWKQYVKGYTILDCTMAKKDRYLLVLQEENPRRDQDPSIRLLTLYDDEPMETRCYALMYEEGMSRFIRSAVALINKEPEYIAMDIYGQTYAYRIVEDGLEDRLNTATYNDGELVPIDRVKRVNGKMYAMAGQRCIFVRTATNKWELVPGIDRPIEAILAATNEDNDYSVLDHGFSDIDAFSENDMYAVGGYHGEVWHFNGTEWRECTFPSQLVQSVCCAGDGNVYISSYNKNIWVGRNDEWKLLTGTETDHGYADFIDLVWFDNRLWCGEEGQLWVLDGNKLVIPADMPAEISKNSSSGKVQLSLDGTHIITAGFEGVAIYDGTSWELLFSKNAIKKKP